MKIKVIDLLLKIANGEKLPEKIVYEDNVYYLGKNMVDLHTYQTEGSATRRKLSLIIDNECLDLNEDVEIIEEDKKIEKIDDRHYDEINQCYCGRNELSSSDLVDKINELIDEINKLKEND